MAERRQSRRSRINSNPNEHRSRSTGNIRSSNRNNDNSSTSMNYRNRRGPMTITVNRDTLILSDINTLNLMVEELARKLQYNGLRFRSSGEFRHNSFIAPINNRMAIANCCRRLLYLTNCNNISEYPLYEPKETFEMTNNSIRPLLPPENRTILNMTEFDEEIEQPEMELTEQQQTEIAQINERNRNEIIEIPDETESPQQENQRLEQLRARRRQEARMQDNSTINNTSQQPVIRTENNDENINVNNVINNEDIEENDTNMNDNDDDHDNDNDNDNDNNNDNNDNNDNATIIRSSTNANAEELALTIAMTPAINNALQQIKVLKELHDQQLGISTEQVDATMRQIEEVRNMIFLYVNSQQQVSIEVVKTFIMNELRNIEEQENRIQNQNRIRMGFTARSRGNRGRRGGRRGRRGGRLRQRRGMEIQQIRESDEIVLNEPAEVLNENDEEMKEADTEENDEEDTSESQLLEEEDEFEEDDIDEEINVNFDDPALMAAAITRRARQRQRRQERENRERLIPNIGVIPPSADNRQITNIKDEILRQEPRKSKDPVTNEIYTKSEVVVVKFEQFLDFFADNTSRIYNDFTANCGICLEPFVYILSNKRNLENYRKAPEKARLLYYSTVKLTNENPNICQHIFHSDCLEKFYVECSLPSTETNINPYKACPECRRKYIAPLSWQIRRKQRRKRVPIQDRLSALLSEVIVFPASTQQTQLVRALIAKKAIKDSTGLNDCQLISTLDEDTSTNVNNNNNLQQFRTPVTPETEEEDEEVEDEKKEIMTEQPHSITQEIHQQYRLRRIRLQEEEEMDNDDTATTTNNRYMEDDTPPTSTNIPPQISNNANSTVQLQVQTRVEMSMSPQPTPSTIAPTMISASPSSTNIARSHYHRTAQQGIYRMRNDMRQRYMQWITSHHHNYQKNSTEYDRFIQMKIHYNDRWKEHHDKTKEQWDYFTSSYNIDYRCHPAFKRNVMLVIYNELGKNWTIEDIITAYANGLNTISRLFQYRNREGTVIDYDLICYQIANPILWQDHCIRRGYINFDNHEIRDWRRAGRPAPQRWIHERKKWGRISFSSNKSWYESFSKDQYKTGFSTQQRRSSNVNDNDWNQNDSWGQNFSTNNRWNRDYGYGGNQNDNSRNYQNENQRGSDDTRRDRNRQYDQGRTLDYNQSEWNRDNGRRSTWERNERNFNNNESQRGGN